MTVNIINKWENIGENYLDSNLEFTNDLSKKLSFEETLTKTIESLPARIEDIKGLPQALYEISFRDFITKIYAKDNPLTSYDQLLYEITSRLDGKSFEELKQAFNSPILTQKKIKQKDSEKRETLTYEELKQKDLNKKISLRAQKFFSQKIIREISLGCSHHGLVYSIENKKGSISHLIGTIHLSHSLLVNTKIPQIVTNCTQLWREIEFDPLLPDIDTNCMDNALAFIAFNKDIPIYGLDHKKGSKSFEDIIYSEIEKEIFSWTSDQWDRKFASCIKKIIAKGEQNQFKEYYSGPKLLWKAMHIDAWENGDSQVFNSLMRIKKAISVRKRVIFPLAVQKTAKIRNEIWMQELLPLIKNTKYPIAITVGSGHLFGKKGLLKMFESNGLVVKQIF